MRSTKLFTAITLAIAIILLLKTGPAINNPSQLPAANPNPYIGVPVWNPDLACRNLTSAFSPDGHLLAIAAPYDGLVFLWDLRQEPIQKILAAESSNSAPLVFTADGNYLLGAFKSGLYRWRIDTDKAPDILKFPADPLNPIGEVSAAALSPNGKMLAVSAYQWHRSINYDDGHGHVLYNQLSQNAIILLCDLDTMTIARTIDADRQLNSIAFSPDGSLISATKQNFFATSRPYDSPTSDCGVNIWSSAGGQLVRSLNQKHTQSSGLFFSADGNSLIVLSTEHRRSPVNDVPVTADVFDLTNDSKTAVKSVQMPDTPLTWMMPQSDQLPNLLLTSRGSGYYSGTALSPNHHLLATIYNGQLVLNDAKTNLWLQISFFPTNRPQRTFRPNDEKPIDPIDLAKNVQWFITMSDPTGFNYCYWTGSANAGKIVAWNLCMTGVPGPTDAEVSARRRPDLILQALAKAQKPDDLTHPPK